MRHRKHKSKLNRTSEHRKAMLRNMAISLITYERIHTTVTKAKAVRPKVEKMITLAKRDTLNSRRQAAAFLLSDAAVKKLFDTIGPRFAERPGGYTRIMRVGFRKGDGAEEAIIELLGSELKKRGEERRRRKEERLKEQQAQSEEMEAAAAT